VTLTAQSALDVELAPAGEDQTAAVLTLLPELATAQLWPDRVWLAHLKGDRTRIVGAAAYEPVVHGLAHPGFRALVQVLGGFRRRGTGRALAQRLCADARRWQVPSLHSWGPLQDEGCAFAKACGWRPGVAMHHFIGEARHALPVAARLVAALRSHGRVPAAFRLCPLGEVPMDAVATLYVSQFGGPLTAGSRMIRRQLEDPWTAALSFGLWDGQVLAGFLLAGVAADMSEVRYWVTDPTFRQGWPAAVLLEQFIRRSDELGRPRARYCCNEAVTATLNFAKKSASQVERVSHSYRIDLQEQEILA
jgi:GNAT superfamily N-acetyltransferase